MGRMYRSLILKNNKTDANVVAFVDTGSDKCIISDRIAKYLKLKRLGEEKLEVANQCVLDTEISYVRVLSAIDKIDDVIDVNITDAPFKDDPEENINMIIGVDFLQQNNIKLVFGKSKGRGK